MNQWLIDIIVANVREPVQVIGDIYSEISSNEVGGRRLIAMMDEFGLEHLDDLAKHILDHSREASLAAINRLPHGTYHNSMMVDGINGQSMEIKAKLTIGPDGIDVDFAGSPGMVQLGINVPLCYTEAYTSFGVKCIVAPRVPNNAASLATIRVTAPEGCILNAKHPAPVAARSIIGQMLPDVGVRLPAAGTAGRRAGRGHVVPVERAADGRHGPGRRRSGAAAEGHAASTSPRSIPAAPAPGPSSTACRPRRSPAASATCRSRSPRPSRRCWCGPRNTAPIRAAPANIAAGWARSWRSRAPRTCRSASRPALDRVVYPPRGRAGGGAGMTGRVELASGKTLAPKAHSSIPVGERLRVSMPGGGGYGDPRKRPAAKVADDVARGLVSAEKARELYGVALTADFKVDEAETAKLRTQVAAE